MRLGSLFSGLGTAEIATKAVFDDARCVFACEIDKYARASFEANVSCEEFYKDVREIDGSKYKDKIRVLSPREYLRLQGFDGSYKIVVSNSQMYKQAGNAMSLNVLTMVLESIKEAHKGV